MGVERATSPKQKWVERQSYDVDSASCSSDTPEETLLQIIRHAPQEYVETVAANHAIPESVMQAIIDSKPDEAVLVCLGYNPAATTEVLAHILEIDREKDLNHGEVLYSVLGNVNTHPETLSEYLPSSKDYLGFLTPLLRNPSTPIESIVESMAHVAEHNLNAYELFRGADIRNYVTTATGYDVTELPFKLLATLMNGQ